MIISFKTRHNQGMSYDFKEIWCSSKKQLPYEIRWSLPEHAGRGVIKRIELRPGFYLFIADYMVNEQFVTNIDCPKPAFGFGFLFSGKINGMSATMKFDTTAKGGDSQIFYYPDQTGMCKDAKGSYRRSVSLLIEPDVFHALVKGEFDRMPSDFRMIADGSREDNFFQGGMVTSAISPALNHIFNCPYSGVTKMLFLESKALELIALRLEQLIAAEKNNNEERWLHPRDIERIHDAAKFLLLNLEKPPTLFQLAKSVGISHSKLNKGFHQVFGTTAFGYLRGKRLKQARQLLEQGRLNVTETAYEVGYNSLSSFSRAFFNQYGCKPNVCMKNSIHN